MKNEINSGMRVNYFLDTLLTVHVYTITPQHWYTHISLPDVQILI